jgi:hypothetical protein
MMNVCTIGLVIVATLAGCGGTTLARVRVAP